MNFNLHSSHTFTRICRTNCIIYPNEGVLLLPNINYGDMVLTALTYRPHVLKELIIKASYITCCQCKKVATFKLHVDDYGDCNVCVECYNESIKNLANCGIYVDLIGKVLNISSGFICAVRDPELPVIYSIRYLFRKKMTVRASVLRASWYNWHDIYHMNKEPLKWVTLFDRDLLCTRLIWRKYWMVKQLSCQDIAYIITGLLVIILNTSKPTPIIADAK